MIDSALKLTIPIVNTSGENFQMGGSLLEKAGRRKKSRGKRGGEEKPAAKVGAKVFPMTEIDEEVGEDYSLLDRIPAAKDEDETTRLARIAEEGRGGPEYLTSKLQEEGRAGPPSFEVRKGGTSRKRKNRTKQRRGKSKRTGRGKTKKARRGKR